MPPRIAITGSAGVGKSTLGRRLAGVLGVPYIGEGMREYLEATGADLHRLGHDGVRALVLRLWEERKAAEAAAPGGFVADRPSYDFAAFWLFYRFAAEDEATVRLLHEALDPGRYDLVVVLPWGRIPLQADGVRSTDRFLQLQVQLLLEGCSRRHARRLVEIDEVDLDARVAAVLAEVAGAR